MMIEIRSSSYPSEEVSTLLPGLFKFIFQLYHNHVAKILWGVYRCAHYLPVVGVTGLTLVRSS